MLHAVFNWILHVTGADNVSGPWYGFWSGFGSDIAEFTLFGVLWHRVNCHAKGCWRVGIHPVHGTAYVTCRKHHPDIKHKASAAHIARARQAAAGTLESKGK